MIAATLFSGIGAPEAAMPRWQWKWCAEIEAFPRAVLACRHPSSINLGDVTADDFAERAAAIARPDVIVFGSPCQSFSIAGKRLGMDDPRGNLALVALGIIARIKPRWFVFENVPGLLSSDGGRDWGLFLRAVDDIGYHVAWTVLDAQHFGVAQRRQRLFAVGHSGDWRGPAAVLFEPEGVCGHHPPRRQAGERIAPTIAGCPKSGNGFGTDFACDGGLIAADLRNGSLGDVAQTIKSGGDGGLSVNALPHVFNNVTHALSADGFDASEDGTGRGTPLIAVAFAENSRAEVRIEGGDGQTTGALKRGGGKAGQGYPAIAFSSKTSAVRRLTPCECERLQGFPDDYTLVTYRGKPAADGPRYKALGNSMAVPVARWILGRLEQVDKLMADAPLFAEAAE